MLIAFAIAVLGCSNSSGPLAPYQGGRDPLSKIIVEGGSYRPEVTWVGGYVSMFGINRGSSSALDSSLVWLVIVPKNNLSFPSAFGTLPAGGQDLTASYGGATPDSLHEDSTYTFWVLKEEATGTVLANPGLRLRVDTLGTESGAVNGDTVFIGLQSYIQRTMRLDLFINIANVQSRGAIATFQVQASNIDNHPRINWQADTVAAAVGIVDGSEYNVNKLVWEVLSIDTSSGQPVYRSLNVISPPIIPGQSFPDTEVFTQYPEGGLQRGKTYFFWIADNQWDGIGHQRFTAHHAYVLFETW